MKKTLFLTPVLLLLLRVSQWIAQCGKRKSLLVLGGCLGSCFFYMLGKQRKRAIRHIQKAYPDSSLKQVENIAHDVFRTMGKNFFEWLRIPALSKERINELVQVHGLEQVNEVLSVGKGGIIVTAHVGNWEYVGAYFTLNGYPGTVIAKDIPYTSVNKMLVDIRASTGLRTIYSHESIKKAIQCLKNNELLGIVPDQDIKRVKGVFIDFFGTPAFTPVGPTILAALSQAPIIPCFMIRQGMFYDLFIEKPIHIFYTNKKDINNVAWLQENTVKWHSVVSAYIQKYKEQWVWFHRRWKTKEVPI